MDEIEAYLKARIVEKSTLLGFDPGPIGNDFSLTGSGVFDSMDFMTLIADVEAKFGVMVQFEDTDPEVFTVLGGFLESIIKE